MNEWLRKAFIQLSHTHLTVQLSACISEVPNGWISIKRDTEDCYENPNLDTIRQKCLALYKKMCLTFNIQRTVHRDIFL